MTKIVLILSSLFVSFLPAAAQTQAEIDKMVKDAQALAKKYTTDTTLKKTISDLQKNNAGTTSSLYASDPGSYGNVDNWKFPPKNTALLAALPKKTFTKAELVTFLNDIYSQISKKLTTGVAASVQAIAAKYNNDGNAMGDAAITGWYSNYLEEGLLLIIKASINNPDNKLLLNNCAALLNMGGIEHKAIPILKYLLQSYPENSVVLNNLGQAYAGLGETDTAMLYLGRCIRSEPEHPEACNTAGQIEATKGNKEKAIEYFEKSIKGAYNKTAGLKLRKLKPGTKLTGLIRPKVKLPEYFNLFKYQLPAQCTSVENAVMAEAEHDAFRKMIDKQSKAYGARIAELEQKLQQKVMGLMSTNGAGSVLRKDEFMAHPFYEMCNIMARDVLSEYQKELSDLNTRVKKNCDEALGLLENEYQDRYKTMMKANFNTSEESCAAQNALANSFLPKFAAVTEDYQKKVVLHFRKYFDELAYWHYLSLNPTGADNFKMTYYMFIEHYLVAMGSVAWTKIIKPCNFNSITLTYESNAIKEFECPLEIEIPFIIGKFALDCDKISFSAGEGAVFGYEKNFKTKQSTLSVGIGAKLELGKLSVGPVEAGLSAGVGETLFITFDGENKVADAGLKFGAKLSGGVEVKGQKELTPGKSIEVKKDLGSKEVSVGYSFGISSGFNFNEGPFKGKL